LKRSAVSTRFADFWLLGGASIVLWAVMQLGDHFRDHSEAIASHFLQVGTVFSMMSIVCNHPHFMISYRFGYGSGTGLIRRHWFRLLAVPLGLIAFFTLAYLKFDSQISELPWVIASNNLFDKLGLGFRLGTLANLGTEILSLSVLLMNLTVGWHYSKQVFGCIMVYGRYDHYSFSKLQRWIIKASLFSVAFLNFFSLSIYAPGFESDPLAKSYFFNIPMIPLGLPKILIPATAATVVLLAIATIGGVFYVNYRRHGKLPSANLVVPWIAFHIWWLPFFRQNEYYFATIPFFHSLQYLPFAYRREAKGLQNAKWPEIRTSLFLSVLLFVGFCAFELVPSHLDRAFETTWYLHTWFFMIAFAVFINVHHFFIDSVVWKFDQKDVQESLLG
jgi:hypothetical protein